MAITNLIDKAKVRKIIDGFKIWCFYEHLDEKRLDKLFSNSNVIVKKGTGLYRKEWIEYKHLTIIKKKNGVEVNGSFHHYFNNAKQNYNFFSFTNLTKTVKQLCKDLGLNIEKTIIQNIEFGFNIELSVEVNNVYQYLFLHKTQSPELDIDDGFQYKYFKHTQFRVKIYDKSKQFSLPYNLIRFELKFNKMEKLNGKGIFTLHDILDMEKLHYLSELLLKSWSECLLYEQPIINIYEHSNQLKLANWRNPIYWIDLVEKTKDLYKNTLGNERKEYYEYQKNYTQNIKAFIAKKIYLLWCQFETS